MSGPDRASTIARYDRLSRYYARFVDPLHAPPRQRGIAGLDLSDAARVLDVGCATGQGLATIANVLGPHGTAVGLDAAGAMCRRARNRVSGKGSSGIVRGDARSMPFVADTFDAVLVSFTLELFDAPERAELLQEVRRVLAPDGRVAVAAASGVPRGPVVRMYESLNDLAPTLVESRPIDTSAVLARAGFSIVRTDRVRAPLVPVDVIIARCDPSERH